MQKMKEDVKTLRKKARSNKILFALYFIIAMGAIGFAGIYATLYIGSVHMFTVMFAVSGLILGCGAIVYADYRYYSLKATILEKIDECKRGLVP